MRALPFISIEGDPIKLHRVDKSDVDKFTYLGSSVSKDEGADKDIKSCICDKNALFILVCVGALS